MTETKIRSYPKVYNLGHAAILDLLKGDVTVEEKVDGSQFSFGVLDGELRCRSRGKQIVVDEPEKMFAAAVATASELIPLLKEGWVYRGEYLQRPKHNTLTYERMPHKHIVLFDVAIGDEQYLESDARATEAARLGLEVVPTFYKGRVRLLDDLKALLATESFLGGPKVEGVVIKRYGSFGRDGKTRMGKFVSEEFKERHTKEWKKANPTRLDVVAVLIAELSTEQRWEKAVQHLRDAGKLTEDVQDIGPLIKEVQADVREEEGEYIADELFRHAWPQIQRALARGLPQWYKKQLAERAFVEAS